MSIIGILGVVHEELQHVEQRMREVSKTEYERLAAVVDYLLDSGGKRLRPAMAILASKFYPADHARVISLAAALEMLHTATLVHDDMVDDSPMRRGNPTLNASWNGGATVLAGDYLFAWAAFLCTETKSVRVMSLFAQALMTICSGELKGIFDSDWRHQTREDYYQRIYSKTASLFALAAEGGAILSDAPKREVQAMHAYGRNLGMAFQVVDDVLDFVGDERDLGKPVGHDLRQGILTLPTMYFLDRYPQHRAVSGVLNGHEQDEEKVQEVVATIRDSGAIEAAMTEAKDFALKGQEALRILPHNKYRQAMLDLADYVVGRRQ